MSLVSGGIIYKVRISAQILYYQKLESLSKICAADSVCLSLLVFTQLFFESRTAARSQPAKPARKQNLTRSTVAIQARSFKVAHFGIAEKPTMDCMSLYNNGGLISKLSEEIAIENAKIAVFDNPAVV